MKIVAGITSGTVWVGTYISNHLSKHNSKHIFRHAVISPPCLLSCAQCAKRPEMSGGARRQTNRRIRFNTMLFRK